VTFEDWIFGLHVTMAALLVGSLVMSWIVVVSLFRTDTPGMTLSLHRVKLVATGATVIGLLGTISLGIWTAILRINIHPWDGWVIALVAGAIYVATAPRWVIDGDNAELVTIFARGGVAHPPGYPLYTLLGHLWIAVLPWGSVAWRISR